MDHVRRGPSERSLTSSAPTASASWRVAYRDVAPKPAYSQGGRARLILAVTWPSSTRPRTPPGPRIAALGGTASRSRCSPATTNWSAARFAEKSASPPNTCCSAAEDRATGRCRAQRGGGADHAVRPAVPGPQAAHHPGPCRGRGTSSGSWATASTTRRPSAPPTWAFRWTRRSTSPRNRRTSSCWRRACWCWRRGFWRGGRSSPTSSSTSGWGPAPTSATCSASSAQASSCRSCRWPRSRS